MRSYPIPFNECGRQAALSSLTGLSEEAEPVLDRIVEVVRQIMDTPTALVSLVGSDKQWFKARNGLDLAETPRNYAICAHTIMTSGPLIVPDALADRRFAKHPVVINPPHVRFYAGAPIILSSGFRIGSLCAIDYVGRNKPAADAVETLKGLAAVVAAMLETKFGQGAGPEKADAAPANAADNLCDEFLALISHELRTPLNGVLGLASVLQTQLRDPVHQSLLDGVMKSGDHLAQIVERILAFSNASTGDLALDEAPIASRTMADSALDLVAPAAEVAGKTVRLGPFAAPEELFLDRTQFELALSCILGNAVTHGGSTIQLSCRMEANGEILFEVSDDGDGIDPKRTERALQPFMVAGDVLQRKADGIGLGLPLSKKLLELHGGELAIGRRDGCTVVSIRLPAWRGSDANRQEHSARQRFSVSAYA